MPLALATPKFRARGSVGTGVTQYAQLAVRRDKIRQHVTGPFSRPVIDNDDLSVFRQTGKGRRDGPGQKPGTIMCRDNDRQPTAAFRHSLRLNRVRDRL